MGWSKCRWVSGKGEEWGVKGGVKEGWRREDEQGEGNGERENKSRGEEERPMIRRKNLDI